MLTCRVNSALPSAATQERTGTAVDFQQAAEAIHDAGIDDTNWLPTETLLGLHATLLARLPEQERAGRLRTGEMRIRPPFDGARHRSELPGPEVAEASGGFSAVFDTILWRDIIAHVTRAVQQATCSASCSSS